MSEAMENATMNTPAEKAEETKAEKLGSTVSIRRLTLLGG